MITILGAGMLRLLWLMAYSLWQERNIILAILFALAAYPIATDSMIRSVVGPVLMGALMIGGAYKALDEVVPAAMELWLRLHRLQRLALVGVLLDASVILQSVLMTFI
ncbi:MAG: hypothetical protein QM758_26385 [Armatimonas sp.]